MGETGTTQTRTFSYGCPDALIRDLVDVRAVFYSDTLKARREAPNLPSLGVGNTVCSANRRLLPAARCPARRGSPLAGGASGRRAQTPSARP
jgi:hypothetical protein